jgi:threonine/homoserine/homoserine lactone efflux protein
MDLDILPLAITMMVGPGIMADIVLITAPKPVKVSAAFVAGVAIATTIGVLAAYALASLLASSVSLGAPSNGGSIGNVIQYLLVALLVFLAIRSYVQRETAEPPTWMGVLQNADPRRAFTTGLLLIWVMPSDIIIMLTVGMHLAQNDAGLVDALPFIAATALVAALPILLYLLFRRRAQRLMPKVRDWMNANSWLVNIIAYVAFIALIVL